ncbi:MAG: DUF362 domain-containing protein [Thermodesulfobacteriota bacterium]
MTENSKVFSTNFTSWTDSVRKICEAGGLKEQVEKNGKPVLIKPNLVENLAPPITTPVQVVEGLVAFLQEEIAGVEIVIGEGCGATEYDTHFVFKEQGYEELATKRSVRLVDLNDEPLQHLENPKCLCWPEMYLPEILFDVFLLSVPVLKAHSLAGVTLTMKNMMGAAPPSHFQQGGAWKKAAFHARIDPAIFDLNTYRTPDFTLLDATIGMQQAHLWGPTCNPPKNRLAAASDPVAIDAWGTDLLGFDWQQIGYLKMADGVLGSARYEQCII